MSQNKKPQQDSNDHPAWKIINEKTKDHNDETNKKIDVTLDLKQESHPWAKTGVTVGAAIIIIGAFIFAPWSNPLKNFAGDLTEETAFEDLFGEDNITETTIDEESITNEPTSTDSLAELFGETPTADPINEDPAENVSELDALAQLFGEEPPTDINQPGTNDPLPQPDIISEPTPVTLDPVSDPAPITDPNFTDTTVPVALESDDDLTSITPEPLPAVTPIVTPEPPTNQLPPEILTTNPTITTENTNTPIPTTPNLLTTNPSVTNNIPTPFPINIHTVDRVAQNTPQPTNNADYNNYKPSAPNYYNNNQNTPPTQYENTPQYVAKSGPEQFILALLFIVCSFVSWFITRHKKAS
jgi:hypothetical protein